MALNSSGGGGNAGAIKAGAAFVTLFTRNEMRKGLDAAAADLKAFGRNISSIGKQLTFTGALGATAFGGIFAASTARGSEFAKLSEKLGDSTENLSAFAYAAKTTGIDLNGLLDNFENWPERLSQAATGTGAIAEAFQRLGIDAAKMKSLPITEQMVQLAEAMKGVGNNTDRLALLGNLFSDKGQGLNSLFKLGGDGIRKLMAEAGSVGAVVSTEQAKNARDISQAWTKSFEAMKNAAFSIGDALLPSAPAIQKIGEQVTIASAAFRQWIAENRELVYGVGAGIAAVGTLGVGMMALGPVITGIGASWGVLTGAVVASKAAFAGLGAILAAPVLAIPAALAAAGAAWLAFTNDGRATAQGWAASISAAFKPTLDNLTSSFSQMVKLFSSGNLAGAFTVGLDAIRVEWARLVLFLQESWAKFTVGWERSIDATGIGLVRLGRRVGIYSPQEAADIEKTMLDMGREAEKQLANPQAVKEARVELANAQDWQRFNAAELAKATQQADIAAKFRQAFAMMKGDGMAGNPLAGQLQGIALASRGTFGASAGFFGGSGGTVVGEKLLAEAKKQTDAIEKTNELLAKGNLAMPGGGMLFVGGK